MENRPHSMTMNGVLETSNNAIAWEFDCINIQNLSDSLLLFSTPTYPPHHVSATQELSKNG